MKICKIWDADYPWDVRVEKVCESLIEAGHEVHLVCRNQRRQQRLERQGQLNIHRLPVLPRVLDSVHKLANSPFPVNPVWIQTIGSVIRQNSIDLILVRDILLAFPGVILGRIFGIPVVLDMAENYPAMESQERLVRAGLSPDRLSVVNNTPRRNQWGPRQTRGRDAEEEGLALIYLGNLDGSRGIDVTIRALRNLKDQDFLATLSVIGEGPNLDEFRAMARQLEVSDRVTFTGRLPFSRVQDFVDRSDVGLIPHYATDAWNTTIPNKLFDYMASELPVIVSDAKPMARIVREERCGMVFIDRDPYDLARCVKGLVDPVVRKQMGQCGQTAIRRRYNWDHDSRVLVKTLETLGMMHVS